MRQVSIEQITKYLNEYWELLIYENQTPGPISATLIHHFVRCIDRVHLFHDKESNDHLSIFDIISIISSYVGEEDIYFDLKPKDSVAFHVEVRC